MTEDVADQVVRPDYEQIRDGIPHSGVREIWRGADARAENTRQALANIDADESLSDEGKREKAQQVIDSNAPRVLQAYEDARKKTAAAAETSWRFSIPMPGDHETLGTTREGRQRRGRRPGPGQ